MILVTGPGGTIGAATVAALRARNARFKVAVRDTAKAAEGVEAVRLDWDDLDSYLPALEGAERLFLLTPNSERQLGYVLQAVAAAKRAGVRRVVRLSAAGAGAESGFVIGRLHRAAERELELSGIPTTSLRPTGFMQNFFNYYGATRAASAEVYLPNGDGKGAWIDAADVGEVAAEALTADGHEGKTYELTGPEALSTAEALAIIGEALGHTYTYVDVPEEAARKAMERSGLPFWMADAFLELSALIRNGSSGRVTDDVRAVLGRPPRSAREWAEELAASA